MEKIAIIGLSCLLPGAENPEQYWQNLIDQKDLTSKATADQMGVDAQIFYDPIKGKTDKYYCLKGGYIRDFQFDPNGYQISSKLLKSLDNIYQWSLYVSKQALQDSGYFGKTAQCGVILGNLSFPTQLSHPLFAPIYQKTLESAIQTLLKNDDFRLTRLAREVSPLNALISGYPATLIAQSLSLAGPHFSLDAACASSLYAIKLACQYLLSGKADLMLAGAVSGADPFFINMGFSIFQAYPENNMSRPFDKSSDGLVAGEGAGMLVLKRYSDAIREGDKIYATISGIGLSNDGKGKFVLNPNPKGQQIAFERAYTDASINPNSLDYIECHATGTPVGDITELNSMESFFGKHHAVPLIGSVKSNLGHLLTTAGMASLIKVILSLKKGIIPATINLTEPLSSNKGVFSAEKMVRTTMPWPQKTHSKLAAVSAFGFGGTNAHLILEALGDQKSNVLKRGGSITQLALVGMDAFFGGCHGLDTFDRTIYDGIQHFIPVPSQRWQGLDAQKELLKNYGFEKGEAPLGAYIQDFEIDFLHFKIPARDDDQLIPQQLLMLKVADNAIRNAGLVEGGNVAVIVAMGTELALHQFRGRCDLSWQIKDSLAQANIVLSPDKTEELEAIAKDSLHPAAQLNQYTSFIGNIMACRIAAQWDFTGPAFTVSAEENAVFSALEVAQQFLATGEVDAVVLGAVDLAGGFESMLLRHQLAPINSGVNTLSYDEKANGWMVGEGAGAVVLKRLDTALAAQDRIYAVIDAISLTSNNAHNALLESLPKTPTAEVVTQSCKQAFDIAGIKATDIGYLEVFGSGVAQEDAAEIKGLTKAYKMVRKNDSLITAIGSVKANIGHTYAASGMASLIKTALCLYHRYIPAVPQWKAPKMPEQWQGSPFYVATESKNWFLEESQSKRVASINGLGLDGTYAHLILSEADSTKRSEAVQYRQQTAFYLFPLAADNQSALHKQLNDLQKKIEQSDDLGATASETFTTFQNEPQAHYRLSIVGHDKNELHQQIAFAMQGIKKAFETGEEWKTPLGSYFTAKPLEKVAFVYPAMGTIYIGLGRELFRLYPKLYETETLGNHINTLLHDKLLYPRSLEKLPIKKQQEIEAQLYNDGAAMCQIGISFDLLQTAILREYFQIQPQAAFGYSQGELSGMMYALGVWRDNKMLTESLPSSPLYQTQLTGPCFAAHQFWKLPLNLPTKNVWCSYVLKASVTAVKDRIKHEKCVYLTFISTPEEVTIAGDPKACLRVIKTLKCPHFLIPFNNASHCEIAQPEYEALVQIHLQKVHKVSGITFYSSLDCAPLPLDSNYIAHNSAKLSCQTVDFPGIINRVYKEGVRVFIEIGAGNNCARWIDETLKGKEHVAMSINSKEVDDQTGIVKVLAKLVSHRVSVDLSPLYPMPENCSKPRKSLVKKITLGGKPIYTTILTDENRKSFENQIISHNPMLKIIQLQIAGAMQSSPALTPPRDDVIWDEADLLEFAEGKIANVFGPEYAIIDSYSRRVQLPLPPYLLVSRVTKLNAKRGLFKASTLTTEYDIPHNMWYSVDGQIPWAVAVESGQCDLLLISYLGIDFENKGILVYRLLDCTMTFLEDIPTEGDTLRYDISINSFVRHGNNLLFFFSYDCFVGDKMVLTMDGGCAGFFTDDELNKGKGVVYSKKELAERDQIQKQQFEPLLICQKSSFDQKDMIHLTKGNIAACFGEHYWQAGLNPSLRVPPKEILMIDQVTSVEFNGGAYGLGLIIGEKILEPEHWYFPCHFKDDQVMAGSLMAEGCGQLLQFYLLYLGFQTCTTDARFQPIPNLRQVVRCRGQVTPISATLIYRLEITELGLTPKPYAKGDVEIILNDKIVVHFKDVGLQLSEKNPDNALPIEYGHQSLSHLIVPRKPALLNEDQIQEFCLGSVSKCFGAEYEIYDTGRISASRMPNTHLNYVHRVLEVKGKRHQLTKNSAIVTEYDAPVETWYYHHNASKTVPYSILMEIALQPCGFLSAYLGTTLLYPDQSLYFRNLDGRGRILRQVDIRGKTVTNTARLLSSSNIQGMIIQSFDFEMVCDGEAFYQGDATFGFFSPNALANQIGLDGGKAVLPWIETENRPGLPIISIDLKNQVSRDQFYQINAQKPGYRLAQHQLDLLDEVKIVKGGGRHQQGYIYARQQIKPTDWYFKCHFHQDPVMPGSLGVEAILQAMQVYALQLDLGQHLKSPRFGQLIDHEVIWKYRGQIQQPDDQTEMYLEVHLSKVEIGQDKVTLMGEASLWKPKLRIYEVKNVAVCLLESTV